MNNSEFENLKMIISALRHPTTGCPWDLKQTHESLLKYLLEESYEFIEAVEFKSDSKMQEELGDVLLQVLLHAKLGEERNAFDIESISKELKEKLIRRHPHVFENQGKKLEVSEVLYNWEQIKNEEKSRENAQKSKRIKPSIIYAPALTAAVNIGNKTKEIKFDWDHYSQVAYKVEEEWQELKEELAYTQGPNQERIFEELGDLLFSISQLSRHLNIDPEKALQAANKKFLKRFYSMEKIMEEKNVVLESLNQEQMDVFWNEAKKREKN